MSFLYDLRERVRALLNRDRENRELEEELRFHIERQTEANERAGMSPREARRQAILRLGGRSRVREATRDARGVRLFQAVVQDVRYGVRGIRKNALFAVALVLTLGLGVGANTAMFSVVDALLLRPLPYGEPDRLVQVNPVDPETGSFDIYMPLDKLRAWDEQDEVFSGTFHYMTASALHLGGAEPVTLEVESVSPTFEEVLRVEPALGRGFDGEDAVPGAEPVAVLSHGYWRTAYGAGEEAIGRSIDLDGASHRIVGVMPAGFRFPPYADTDVWVAFREDGTTPTGTLSFAAVVGRLADRAGLETARQRAHAAAAALADGRPREDGWTVDLVPFDRAPQVLRRTLWFLVGAVGLILLIAILNGLNLVLVRGWSRTRELALRATLGASRPRLLAQLTTEALVLALAGGVLAVGFAIAALRLTGGIMPESITAFAPYAIAVEGRTLLFTFLATTAVGLVIGLLPGLVTTHLGARLVGGPLSAHATRTPARSRLRRGLVVLEVAISCVLLIGAGLFVHSFARLARVDPGFRMERIATLNLSLARTEFPGGQERMAFLRRLESRIEAIPGVQGVTTGGGGLLASGYAGGGGLVAEGGDLDVSGQPRFIPLTSVSPDFFDLLDVRIVVGRPFSEQDRGTDAAIVDLDLAGFLWGTENPIGRRFRVADDRPWKTVVGLVQELRSQLDDRASRFAIVTPAGDAAGGFAQLGIRTAGDPAPLFPAIREAVFAEAPRQPIGALTTLESQYAGAIDMPRFLLVLMAFLSGLALVLAAVGVYGVLAYGVAQRRYELAVRVAIGARPRSLSRAVFLEGLALGLAGIGIGLAGAFALSEFVRSLLYGVEPMDPATVAAVLAVTLTVTVFACWWPARRAMRVDPATVLKSD